MTGRDRNLADVSVGDSLHEIELPVTLQRLVMEAGANRDLSLIHHDKDVARTTGAPDAYANTFFLMGMFERLCREWMGPAGRVVKLGPMKMTAFNVVGDTVRFSGEVVDVDPAHGRVSLSLASHTGNGQTSSCEAVLELNEPARR
jgi:acyl dehydratase